MPKNGIRKAGNYAVQQNRSEQLEKVRNYIDNSKAKNTKRAYKNDWKKFVNWCQYNSLNPMDCSDEDFCLYILSMLAKGDKVSTIRRSMASISVAHKMKKVYCPVGSMVVKNFWKGVLNEKGIAYEKKKPILVDDLKRMMERLSDNNRGLRDRALLLIGFTGAFRRSELVSLNIEDVDFTREGLSINIRKSKTDQQGKGRKIGIPYGSYLNTCPVRTLQEWIERLDANEGPLFRKVTRGNETILSTRLSDRAVALIVKRMVKDIGLNPAHYGGHSLRAGFATSASMAGAGELSIMKQTGHASVEILRGYIRDGDLFRDNAVAKLGL